MFKAYSSKRAALRGAIRSNVAEDAVYQDLASEAWGFDVQDEQASEPTVAEALEQFNKAEFAPVQEPNTPAKPEVEGDTVDEAPKTNDTGRKIQKDRPEANGVKMPSEGTVCRAVWDFCTSKGPEVKVAEVKAEATARNWNPNNAVIEFYSWRKFHGISGRQAK